MLTTDMLRLANARLMVCEYKSCLSLCNCLTKLSLTDTELIEAYTLLGASYALLGNSKSSIKAFGKIHTLTRQTESASDFVAHGFFAQAKFASLEIKILNLNRHGRYQDVAFTL